VIDNGVQLRLDLQRKNRRIDGAERVFQELNLVGIDERRWGNDLFVQAVDAVSVIDAERRLHDGQLDDKLDTRRAAQAKIRVRRDRELVLHVRRGRQVGQSCEAGGVELEGAGASYTNGAP